MTASPLDVLQWLWSAFVQVALVVRDNCYSGAMLGGIGLGLTAFLARGEKVSP